MLIVAAGRLLAMKWREEDVPRVWSPWHLVPLLSVLITLPLRFAHELQLISILLMSSDVPCFLSLHPF